MTEQHDHEMRAKLEAQYDKFAERFRELFESGKERTREAMDKAMERARVQLAEAGEFTAEQGEQLKRYLKRDLDHTAQEMQRLGHEAHERFHPDRLKAGALSSIARIFSAASATLQNWSRKAEEAVLCETGQVTSAGTLTCVNCGHTFQLKKTTFVPPCPGCLGTTFRKSY